MITKKYRNPNHDCKLYNQLSNWLGNECSTSCDQVKKNYIILCIVLKFCDVWVVAMNIHCIMAQL